MKAVLPVRIKGEDARGNAFEDLAHTLDLTSAGVRLGAVRRHMKTPSEVAVFYHQRRMQFRVVWTQKLPGTSEYQVGLQCTADTEDPPWGLYMDERPKPPVARSLSRWSTFWTPWVA